MLEEMYPVQDDPEEDDPEEDECKDECKEWVDSNTRILEYMDNTPFPPPSTASHGFFPKGNANNVAKQSLMGVVGERVEDVPPIYRPPTFETVGDANEYMREKGTPVIVSARLPNMDTVFVCYKPDYHLRRESVIGGSSNLALRISEYRTLAKDEAHSAGGGSSPSSYSSLFPIPPTCMWGFASQSVLTAVIQMLIDTDGPPFTSIPDCVIDVLTDEVRNMPQSVFASKEANVERLLGWAVLNLSMYIHPSKQKRVFEEYLNLSTRIVDAVDAVSKLVPVLPRVPKGARLYPPRWFSDSFRASNGRVPAVVAILVELAKNVRDRCTDVSNHAVVSEYSRVEIGEQRGEVIYSISKIYPALKIAINKQQKQRR